MGSSDPKSPRFLQRNSAEFDWVTPDDPAAGSVRPTQSADRRYPIVRLRDGSLLSDPSNRDIAKSIGLRVKPEHAMYDVAIIGGGPAGLAAAVYGASEGLSTILIEREAPGAAGRYVVGLLRIFGISFGISGGELAHRRVPAGRAARRGDCRDALPPNHRRRFGFAFARWR